MSNIAARAAPPRLRQATRVGAAVAAPRRDPREQPAVQGSHRARPRLQVVDPQTLHRRRRVRRMVALFAIVTIGSMLTAVTFHVKLAESQFELDRLDKQTAAEQRRYEELRLEVAQLAAPDRIVKTAKERLGMVQPSTVTFLGAPLTAASSSPGTVSGDGSADANDFTASTLAESWPKVKGSLAERP